jgi:hypothetical protein
MNINDLVKEMREFTQKAGFTDTREINDIITLSLLKILKGPAFGDEFSNLELEIYDDDNGSYRLYTDSEIGKHTIVKTNDDVIPADRDDYSYRNQFTRAKSDETKIKEDEYLRILKKSNNFKEFYSEMCKSEHFEDNHRLFIYSSTIDRTLLDASQLYKDVKEDNVSNFYLSTAPFASIKSTGSSSKLATFIGKNIEDKLDALKYDSLLFESLLDVDGVKYTSFEQFEDAYRNGRLASNLFMSKILLSDDQAECLNALFEGEWFNKQKELGLKSLKRVGLEQTITEIYAEYPVINDIIDHIYNKHPEFNLPINDLVEIKVLHEKFDTTKEEMANNTRVFADDYNNFKLHTTIDNKRFDNLKYTRLYLKTPLKVLVDIGGENHHSDTSALSILYLDQIKKHESVSQENEDYAINKFLEFCSKNEIICSYTTDTMKSRNFIDILTQHKGKVLSYSQDDDEVGPIRGYQIMLDMGLNYKQMLNLEKNIHEIDDSWKDEEIQDFFNAKIKETNKLKI